MLSNISAVWWL